jgi:hypothetical protein
MIELASGPALFRGATGLFVKPDLLDPRAAPLDQNNQDDNGQNASNNLNSRSIHDNSSFLQQHS